MHARDLRLLLVLTAVVFLAEASGLLAAQPHCVAHRPRRQRAASRVAIGCESGSQPPQRMNDFTQARRAMVERLRSHGIKNQQVLAAMGEIQRQRFVPADRQEQAYSDDALQIGHGQTISSPSHCRPDDGTGAAVTPETRAGHRDRLGRGIAA